MLTSPDTVLISVTNCGRAATKASPLALNVLGSALLGAGGKAVIVVIYISPSIDKVHKEYVGYWIVILKSL